LTKREAILDGARLVADKTPVELQAARREPIQAARCSSSRQS